MARNIFALVMLVGVVGVCIEGAAVKNAPVRKEREGFIFLGSVKREVIEIVFGITTVTVQDWNYWISVNSAGYADARKDCRANGDELLEINSLEERDQVEEWLQSSDQTASSAWVAGKVAGGKWIWESGSDIDPALWGVNQPRESKPNSRAWAFIVGGVVDVRAQANTYATRYICEGV